VVVGRGQVSPLKFRSISAKDMEVWGAKCILSPFFFFFFLGEVTNFQTNLIKTEFDIPCWE
jgi:hypothetical protein